MKTKILIKRTIAIIILLLLAPFTGGIMHYYYAGDTFIEGFKIGLFLDIALVIIMGIFALLIWLLAE